MTDNISGPKLHLALAVTWAIMIIPTLVWLRESILWVAFMSLYANFVGHWSAYQAARAETESSKQYCNRCKKRIKQQSITKSQPDPPGG